MRWPELCRGLLGTALALAVATTTLAAGADPAGAQSEGVGTFADDDGSVHEPSLEALAAQGVLAGMECGDGLICPDEPLQRWEMAVWLVRVVDGADPGLAAQPQFADVDYGQWWAPFVDRLFELGITGGCRTEPARFCANRKVTRAQMATFLTRAFDLEPAPPTGFEDVDADGTHSADIDALAAAGITAGCRREPLRYCPDRDVNRAEMATFLARALDRVEVPASARFTAVDAGWWHSCGLRGDGSIDCWGSNPFGQANAPEGQFSSLVAGVHHSCGLRLDGNVDCWGSNSVGQAGPPPGRFTALSAGWGHSCGLRTDRSIDCWGVNWDGRADPPDGRFSAVAVGDASSCALRADGSITCWGRPQEGEVPAGRFSAITVGPSHSCGLRTGGGVACWGENWIGQATPPEGQFSAVAVGGTHSCGLRAEGTIVCWGSNWQGQAEPPPGRFMALTAGDSHTCGLTPAGTVVCWGGESIIQTGAPSGRFVAIDAGRSHLCGRHADGSLSCTGGNAGQSNAPDGEFVHVSASRDFSCAVRVDATAVCWGHDAHGETFVPDDSYRSIAAGNLHSCGLRTDGVIRCWGDNLSGQTDAPAGQFEAVTASVGGWHSCGLRTDGTLVCWGANSRGQAEAPDGRFLDVAAGRRFTCGLRTDGTLVCWGYRTEAPTGRFESLAAGAAHVCAVRADSTVLCWGDNSRGQADAPVGRFTAVTASTSYSCGLRIDSTVACWGLAMAVAPPDGVVTGVFHGSDPRSCRPAGSRDFTTAGFPLPPSVSPSTGTLRVAVLFLDFPDAAAPYSTRREAERNLGLLEAYLEASSYGLLDVELLPRHGWLRAGNPYGYYTHVLAVGEALQLGIAEEAVGLADTDFDFSGVDALMVVQPSSHFGGGTNAHESVQTQEGDVQTLLINTFRVDGPADGGEWGHIAAHELLHSLGLLDLYPYDASRHTSPPSSAGRTWILTEFGPMGLRAHVPAADWPGAGGGYRRALEMLAWSRWQLGWLDPSQIRCVIGDEARVELGPVADPGSAAAMAAVPLSDREVLVAESRRSIGYDSGPALLAEGVLVYTVDAALHSGLLPIKVTGDTGNAHLDDYPVLAVGDSVTVRDYTITVVADDGATHTVTITRTPSD